MAERFTFEIVRKNDRGQLRANFYDSGRLDFVAEEEDWGTEIMLSLDGYPDDTGPSRAIVLTRKQAADLAPLLVAFAALGTIAEPFNRVK